MSFFFSMFNFTNKNKKMWRERKATKYTINNNLKKNINIIIYKLKKILQY